MKFSRTRIALMLSLIGGFIASRALTASDNWTENYEEAKSRAQKEGKHMLLFFTESDACPFCVKLHSEVFESSEFKKQAPKDFVLVELDFPANKRQSQKQHEQNVQVAYQYGFDGAFPTMILTDEKGEPYAKTGYFSPSELITGHLIELHDRRMQRDELTAKAAKATGTEKAQLLEQIVAGKTDEEIMPEYDDLLRQIVTADAENKAGLKTKYETKLEVRSIATIAEKGDIDGALAKLDEKVADKEATAERKQELLYMKAIILLNFRDRESSRVALKAARDADPASERGKEIAGILADSSSGH